MGVEVDVERWQSAKNRRSAKRRRFRPSELRLAVIINVAIPDKYNQRTIWIFAGIDPVAVKRFDRDGWRVKAGDCSMCGQCCMRLRNDRSWPFVITDGVCEHLSRRPGNNPEYLCGLGVQRPYGCSIAIKPVYGCTVRYEAI